MAFILIIEEFKLSVHETQDGVSSFIAQYYKPEASRRHDYYLVYDYATEVKGIAKSFCFFF